MRQIVLDTETTGLDPKDGHRLIEVGCVELLHRRPSGRVFHRYLNPEREIDEAAVRVHGLTLERLAGEPLFATIADELLDFIDGAELIIHNAAFDIGFINAELCRASSRVSDINGICSVIDTLQLARRRHPGQRNTLDALCKRYGIDNSQRDLHGALLDARILADVYLVMTGGQVTLLLDAANHETAPKNATEQLAETQAVTRSQRSLRVIRATAEELAAHQQLLEVIDKSSGGKCLWKAHD